MQYLMILQVVIYVSHWKHGESFAIKRLLLTSDFGTISGKELAMSADSLLEIEGMSRIVGLFCKENGIDKRKANTIALCIEELGSNIINHGFSDGKHHSIDIRVLVKE